MITDLFNNTPAKALCDSLIGKDAYHPVHSAQIALRFPEYTENRPDDWGAHLDGVLRVHEGIAYNFTLLAGIILSDQRETFSGNFTVYPGTHHKYEQSFKDNGPEILFREESFRDKHRSLNVPHERLEGAAIGSLAALAGDQSDEGRTGQIIRNKFAVRLCDFDFFAGKYSDYTKDIDFDALQEMLFHEARLFFWS